MLTAAMSRISIAPPDAYDRPIGCGIVLSLRYNRGPGDDAGVCHCRHRAARNRNRTQRVKPISTSGVSQNPK